MPFYLENVNSCLPIMEVLLPPSVVSLFQSRESFMVLSSRLSMVTSLPSLLRMTILATPCFTDASVLNFQVSVLGHTGVVPVVV